MSNIDIRDNLREKLTPESAKAAAAYVIEKMEAEAKDSQTLDYDINLSQGSQIDLQTSNTWFKFDSSEGDVLFPIKQAMFEQGTKYTDAELLAIARWNLAVAKEVSANYGDRIVAVIQRELFRGSKIPVKFLTATNFEVVDFSSMSDEENCELIIGREVPAKEYNDGNSGGPIAPELFSLRAQTGKSYEQIVADKKAEGDPNYRFVTSVEKRKFLWECQIDLVIDYSPPPLSSGAAA